MVSVWTKLLGSSQSSPLLLPHNSSSTLSPSSAAQLLALLPQLFFFCTDHQILSEHKSLCRSEWILKSEKSTITVNDQLHATFFSFFYVPCGLKTDASFLWVFSDSVFSCITFPLLKIKWINQAYNLLWTNGNSCKSLYFVTKMLIQSCLIPKCCWNRSSSKVHTTTRITIFNPHYSQPNVLDKEADLHCNSSSC